MAYEIIIKESGTETKLVGGDYTKIDETFFSEKDIQNLSGWNAREKAEKETDLNKLKKPVMGYSPQTEKLVPFEKEIFRQTVMELNIGDVIKAVNSIK